MKKKILFVMDTLRMGGAEKSLISLLKSLDPERLDITLFLFEGNGILQDEIPDYVKILYADVVTRAMTLEFRKYFIDLIKTFHWFAAFSRLKRMLYSRYIKKTKFNWQSISRFVPFLEGHDDVAVGYLEGFPDFYVIDKVNAKQKIGWIHSDLSKQTVLSLAKDYYSRFDALVTISDVCADAIGSLVPSQKVYVFENILRKEDILEKAKKDVNWDLDKHHIITVGRIEHVKGIDLALEAAKLIHKSISNIQWHVYGKGSLTDSIQQIINNTEAQDFFTLEGETTNPYPYMRRADILVQPSRWEGKSVVLDEAKILGKAIVTTNYPSVSDQIKDGKTGLVAEIDPSSIAEKVIQLMKNATLKERLEQNCSEEINESIKTVDMFYQLIDC